MRAAATCFLVLCLSQAAAAQSGRLAVQLVEPGWLPIPEMTVTVVPVATCEATKGSGHTGQDAHDAATGQTRDTDRSGVAQFTIPGKGLYRIAVAPQDDFAGKTRCIRVFDFAPPFETAYVQLQLAPKGPHVAVSAKGRRRSGG